MSQSRSSNALLKPVAVDAMGADRGSDTVVDGVVQAARRFGLPSIIVGDSKLISDRLSKLGALGDARIQVQHASEVVTMEDAPVSAIRNRPDSSMRVACELVKGGQASAVISPGNTGAFLAAGIICCGRMQGIERPAIGTLIPTMSAHKKVVLLDGGANVDCTSEQLVQFALMGDSYASAAFGIASPKVALLSNGSESSKGTDIIRAAAERLRSIPGINFTGYVESHDIARATADVVVCDGFVGNMVLKAMEGTAAIVVEGLIHYLKKGFYGHVAGWFLRPLLKRLYYEKLDSSASGGAPLLGLDYPAIVCHGASNSRAIMNAVKLAHGFVESDVVGRLRTELRDLDNIGMEQRL